jgi:hypothetical protein
VSVRRIASVVVATSVWFVATIATFLHPESLGQSWLVAVLQSLVLSLFAALIAYALIGVAFRRRLPWQLAVFILGAAVARGFFLWWLGTASAADRPVHGTALVVAVASGVLLAPGVGIGSVVWQLFLVLIVPVAVILMFNRRSSRGPLATVSGSSGATPSA